MSIVDADQYLFTSESVTEGHPDKMCDQISDAILDAILRDDPDARVACETATTTGLVLVLGEITTDTYIDFQSIVRDTFYSSLKLSELVLEALDIPAERAARAVALFAAHDEQTLVRSHGLRGDEQQLIQNAQEAAAELASLFEADQQEQAK